MAVTVEAASIDKKLLESILRRAHAHAMEMIYLANNRDDVQRGDPKVGGHPSACSSALHLLGVLHLVERRPEDFIANKPHASPIDHALSYNLRLLRETDGTRMSDERARIAMKNLRHYSHAGDPVFQSYHSAYDPDHWHFLPSGSVGIPPVNALFLAAAHRMAKSQKIFETTDPHFWCLMGDSEFREGSLLEAMPQARERGLANVTWMIDYNRQSLDGNRTFSEDSIGVKDCDRIEAIGLANGWEVIQLRHGSYRREIFSLPGGDALQLVIEKGLPDGELQSLLSGRDPKKIVDTLSTYDHAAGKLLSGLSGDDVLRFLNDFGGHDVQTVWDALKLARQSDERATMIVAHTIKGWSLECAAKAGNHSAMVEEDEVKRLLKNSGAKSEDLFAFERFDESSAEGQYLKHRGDEFLGGIQKIESLCDRNRTKLKKDLDETGWSKETPTNIGINLKLLPMAHTQWMLGQMTAKLNRIGDSPLEGDAEKKQRALTPEEIKWKVIGSHLVTMAPDVGTSTNLNASMDNKTFGPDSSDFDAIYGTVDRTAPDITPHESEHSRHLRFEIEEGNSMSCMGSFGKMNEYLGIPYIPVMTVYDFFIKRALDQLFYDAYWKSHFILVGTPSGISLSPEGAQHGWKSDVQIANLITWEPAFALEFDWIFSESIRRHYNSFVSEKKSDEEDATQSADGRTGVIIRTVTRALDQKSMLERLKTHKRFEGKSDAEILEQSRHDCLEGAWYVVDYRGFDGYRPGENVVNVFSMGVMISEALAASDALKSNGIFANVIQVSSSDLLLGNIAYENNYKHLREGLAIVGDLYLRPRKAGVNAGASKAGAQEYPPLYFAPTPRDQARLDMLGAARVPIVSVHDGEPGLLDNLGSAVGVLHKALAVRHHSKSGRPSDIYHYHGIDAASVKQACLDVLRDVAWNSEVQLTT